MKPSAHGGELVLLNDDHLENENSRWALSKKGAGVQPHAQTLETSTALEFTPSRVILGSKSLPIYDFFDNCNYF